MFQWWKNNSYGDCTIFHYRLSVMLPTPQQIKILPTGQPFVLHVWLDEARPSQDNPPLDGDGLLHNLDLCWIPPPQVTLQAAQFDHDPQLPSKGVCK